MSPLDKPIWWLWMFAQCGPNASWNKDQIASHRANGSVRAIPIHFNDENVLLEWFAKLKDSGEWFWIETIRKAKA